MAGQSPDMTDTTPCNCPARLEGVTPNWFASCLTGRPPEGTPALVVLHEETCSGQARFSDARAPLSLRSGQSTGNRKESGDA